MTYTHEVFAGGKLAFYYDVATKQLYNTSKKIHMYNLPIESLIGSGFQLKYIDEEN